MDIYNKTIQYYAVYLYKCAMNTICKAGGGFVSNSEDLREPMDMPDPYFPIKMHLCKADEIGKIVFPHHWHKHMEFIYITEGKAMIECNSNSMVVNQGEFVIINSNDIHYGVSMSENLSYYAMIADISLLHSQTIDAIETKFITPIIQNSILFQNHITNDTEIQNCILALIHEIQNKELGYELAIKSQLYSMMTILFRKYVVKVLSENQYILRIKNLERFHPVFKHIEENYMEGISVQKLADNVGLSRYHFSRLFKELTDRTVIEYINLIRIHKSEYLLRNTAMNVSEVASATGFNDIYYFSRSFKKHKNISPSALRRI
jgi:AraC-like DNA-binding protein/mannose-6-phosphate isomerase-like protein (cupin superfamily)